MGSGYLLERSLSQRIVAQFNREDLVNKKEYSIVGSLLQADRNREDGDGNIIIYTSEKVIVEEMIQGTFKKFNSNSGWTREGSGLRDFSSHWPWVSSAGEHLLCDLQGLNGKGFSGTKGHREAADGRSYVFADPAIHSNKKGK